MKQVSLLLLAILFIALEFLRPSGAHLWDEQVGHRVDRTRIDGLRGSLPADPGPLFLETAFAPRHGNRIRKWAEGLRIEIHGTPSDQDLRALERAVEELSPLMYPHSITFQEENANVTVYFLPSDELSTYEPNYTPGSPGLYWCWWSRNGRLYRGRMVFSTDTTTEGQRASLIRTYLVRILGFLGTTSLEYDSVLASNTSTHDGVYSKLDRALIELLYCPEFYPGMTRRSAEALLGEY